VATENPSNSRFMSSTPTHHAIRTVSGTSIKHVCMHVSRAIEMLMFILSCMAILIAIGSLLSIGKTIRLRNVCETFGRCSSAWMLSVANCVLKATRTTDTTRATIAPRREKDGSSLLRRCPTRSVGLRSVRGRWLRCLSRQPEYV
jgi:hypothetical protein